MARIAGIDLPRNKRGEIGLTYIYGIGRSTARRILETAGVSFDKKVNEWDDNDLSKIRGYITEELKVEGDGHRLLPWRPSPCWSACSRSKHQKQLTYS
jgi:small subunit ribosomal protein S13